MNLLDEISFNKTCREMMPLRRNMEIFNGDKFQCACGSEHTFSPYTISVIGEGLNGRFLVVCPYDSQYKSLIKTKMKFGIIYKGLELLEGYKIVEKATFVDNKDGTVTDTKTGLMWQKAESGTKNWEEAIAYCQTLGLAGLNDWRLPDPYELKSIEDNDYSDPCVDRTIFPGAMSSHYWSSITVDRFPEAAWSVYFKSFAHSASSYKVSMYNVRAVRGEQLSVRHYEGEKYDF